MGLRTVEGLVLSTFMKDEDYCGGDLVVALANKAVDVVAKLWC